VGVWLYLGDGDDLHYPGHSNSFGIVYPRANGGFGVGLVFYTYYIQTALSASFAARQAVKNPHKNTASARDLKVEVNAPLHSRQCLRARGVGNSARYL
jgi:hypothetical protein